MAPAPLAHEKQARDDLRHAMDDLRVAAARKDRAQSVGEASTTPGVSGEPAQFSQLNEEAFSVTIWMMRQGSSGIFLMLAC